VYIRAYADGTDPWQYLGRAPLDTRGVIAYFQWRITKPGFTPFEGAAGLAPEATFVLLPQGTVPDGMVHVRGDTMSIPAGSSVRVGDFFIDRYEVTNREFKKFVDAGGYRDRRSWTEPFIKDERALS
jgi:formylglycine-generating enzyme required for sulfatase activity